MAPTTMQLILGTMLALAVGAGAGDLLSFRFTNTANAAILLSLAGLAAALAAVSFAVFSKLDGILKDAEDHDEIRLRSLVSYIHGIRIRTLILLIGAVLTFIIVGIVGYLVQRATDPNALNALNIVGYAGAGYVLWYMVRVATLYALLDGFRRDVFLAIAREDRRAKTLAELRPSVLKPFDEKISASC